MKPKANEFELKDVAGYDYANSTARGLARDYCKVGKNLRSDHGMDEGALVVKASLSFHPISSIVYCKFHLSKVPMSLELKKAERGHHSFILYEKKGSFFVTYRR